MSLTPRSSKRGCFAKVSPIAYMACILCFASVPDTPDYANSWFSLNAIVNNFLHIPAYGILLFLWFRALHQKSHSKLRSLFYAIVLTMAFGVFQELAQSFVRGRFVSLADIGLNTIGITLAALYINKPK